MSTETTEPFICGDRDWCALEIVAAKLVIDSALDAYAELAAENELLRARVAELEEYISTLLAHRPFED